MTPAVRTAISVDSSTRPRDDRCVVVRTELAVLPARERQRPDHRRRLHARRDASTPAIAFVCAGVARVVAATGDGRRQRSQVDRLRRPGHACPAARATTRSAAAPGATRSTATKAPTTSTAAPGTTCCTAASGDDSLDGDAGRDQLRGGPGFDSASPHHDRRQARRWRSRSTASPTTASAGRARRLRRRHRGHQRLRRLRRQPGFTRPARDPERSRSSAARWRTASPPTRATTRCHGGGGQRPARTRASGNDTIDARDGYADRVGCGAGHRHRASPTRCDTFSRLRERRRSAPIANATEDAPPTIAWTTAGADQGAARQRRQPARGRRRPTTAASRPCASSTTTGVVCEDTAAPYTLRLPGARRGRRAQHAHARRRRRRRPDREHAARRRPSAASRRCSRSASTRAATAAGRTASPRAGGVVRPATARNGGAARAP